MSIYTNSIGRSVGTGGPTLTPRKHPPTSVRPHSDVSRYSADHSYSTQSMRMQAAQRLRVHHRGEYQTNSRICKDAFSAPSRCPPGGRRHVAARTFSECTVEQKKQSLARPCGTGGDCAASRTPPGIYIRPRVSFAAMFAIRRIRRLKSD